MTRTSPHDPELRPCQWGACAELYVLGAMRALGIERWAARPTRAAVYVGTIEATK